MKKRSLWIRQLSDFDVWFVSMQNYWCSFTIVPINQWFKKYAHIQDWFELKKMLGKEFICSREQRRTWTMLSTWSCCSAVDDIQPDTTLQNVPHQGSLLTFLLTGTILSKVCFILWNIIYNIRIPYCERYVSFNGT